MFTYNGALDVQQGAEDSGPEQIHPRRCLLAMPIGSDGDH
jgi:hypothetical protein